YREARAALQWGEKDTVLLCFGFLAHYKGSDWVVKEIAHFLERSRDSHLRLVLAGGESPNHAGKPHYQQFVSDLTKLAMQHRNRIEITGFIAESRVSTHFCGADLALFPYRAFMSASGPLALALAFGTPFLLSAPLKPI